MIVFGKDLADDENECPFRVTKSSKLFLIGFFGFYPYSSASRFERFILETGCKDIANHDGISMGDFLLDGYLGIEVDDQCGSKTFDPTIILPKTFLSKKDAFSWFEKKLMDSSSFSKSEICEIDVVDAEKFMKFIADETLIEKKKEQMKNEINQKLENFKWVLLEEYKEDKLAVQFIQNTLNSRF